MTDWEKAVAFHGHPCCLLAVGWRAVQVAVERLAPADPEHHLVVVVENRTCAADAVQAVTGCTFGKKNFIFKDNGKHVYYFGLKEDGRALRVSLKPGVFAREGADFTGLMEKVANGTASPDEQEEFYRRQASLMDYILKGPVEEIFEIKTLQTELTAADFCLVSACCSRCGEEVMKDHLLYYNGRPICRECFYFYK